MSSKVTAVIVLDDGTQDSTSTSRATSVADNATSTDAPPALDGDSKGGSASGTTERELGIFVDNAECDDLSDSENGKQPQTGNETQPQQSLNPNAEMDEPISRKRAVFVNDDGAASHGDSGTADLTTFPDVDTTNASDIYNVSVMRAKTNTPVSMFTDFSELHSPLGRRSYPLPPESREAVFQRAMNLMTERCTSRAVRADRNCATPLVANRNPPFGEYLTNYFYIHQKKPVPMPPLKAWRGYHGNVYFEPIQVMSARSRSGVELETGPVTAAAINRALASAPGLEMPLGSADEVPPASSVSRTQPEHQAPPPSMRSTNTQTQDAVSRENGLQSTVQERSLSPATTIDESPSKSHRSSSSRSRSKISKNSASTAKSKGQRQMAILDKEAVFEQLDENLHEDIKWIKGQESTGSLCISPNNEDLVEERRKKYSRERLCRGSMAHKVHADKRRSQQTFTVSGGKVAEMNPSPASTQRLPQRMQTQYTLSSSRKVAPSPDMYYEKRLPPLDQLRTTLQHINSPSSLPAINATTALEMKSIQRAAENNYIPYVKYSPGYGPRANVRLTQSVK